MIFMIAETILYVAFMGMDLGGIPGSTPVKFGAILLVALSALDFREPLVSAALLFTAAADVFLLLLDRYYVAGIACFIAVQVLYALRMNRTRTEGLPPAGLYFVPFCILLLVRAGYGFGWTESFAAAYICLFALNLCGAVSIARRCPRRKWILFAFGLALFFCCDLCVGIHNVPGLGGPALQSFANIAMWGFYLPGQVLIRQSAYIRESEVIHEI
ncbi:MAG: lysoplasmalogenase [Clostridia bacterium]|nr:lysoplasmalogenase [Clostridia bacterium]